MSGGHNNQNAMHELKTSGTAESAVRSIGIVVPLCNYCLQRHGEDDGCKCAECGCGLHPHFIRTAIVDNKPNVICPNCDADKRHNDPSSPTAGGGSGGAQPKGTK